MLFFQNARAKGFFGVVFQDRNGGLGQDWAAVQGFVNTMDRAASQLDAMPQRLLLCMQTRKCGKQGRMDIDDSVGEAADEERAQNSHEPSQDDEVNIAIFQYPCNLVFEGLGVGIDFTFDDEARNTRSLESAKRLGPRLIGDDHRNLRVKRPSSDRVENRL